LIFSGILSQRWIVINKSSAMWCIIVGQSLVLVSFVPFRFIKIFQTLEINSYNVIRSYTTLHSHTHCLFCKFLTGFVLERWDPFGYGLKSQKTFILKFRCLIIYVRVLGPRQKPKGSVRRILNAYFLQILQYSLDTKNILPDVFRLRVLIC
jgi:hypothetical protein